MTVFCMGDTHWGTGDELKLINLSKTHNAKIGDTAIICGDFGGVWYGDDYKDSDSIGRDCAVLNKIKKQPFDVLVVPGNHENYDALFSDKYPIVDYKGGKARQLRRNIFLALYGEIYEIEGKRFWCCGGAASVDKIYRKPHISWWKQEVPADEVIDQAVVAFEANVPDYAITHAAPLEVTNQVMGFLGYKMLNDTYMTNRFQYLLEKYPQTEWHCGHLHCDRQYGNCYIHYDDITVID